MEIEKMNLYEKIMKIRAELLQIEIHKTGKNQYQKFNYYELKDIIPPINNLCNKYRVYTHVSFDIDQAIMRVVNIDNINDVIILHSPMPAIKEINKGTNVMQSIGAYETYQRRYLYLTLFDIIEKDSIDASNQKDVNKNSLLRPGSLDKVVSKIKKDELIVNKKTINKYSMNMFRKKELTREEREEIYNYISSLSKDEVLE